MGCTEKCWTRVACPDCGNRMPPAGRSAPLGSVSECCSENQHKALNTCHLWNEHDSDRAYTDQEGWDAHVASCEKCKDEV